MTNNPIQRLTNEQFKKFEQPHRILISKWTLENHPTYYEASIPEILLDNGEEVLSCTCTDEKDAVRGLFLRKAEVIKSAVEYGVIIPETKYKRQLIEYSYGGSYSVLEKNK